MVDAGEEILNAQLLWGIVSAAAIGLLSWGALLAKSKTRDAWDRRKLYHWLRSNTRDEPGESHVDTLTIAKGTRLPEERVRRACMSDDRVYRSSDEPEKWSVWRKEPQSVYEKRGIRSV
jgi:hypothetical protein